MSRVRPTAACTLTLVLLLMTAMAAGPAPAAAPVAEQPTVVLITGLGGQASYLDPLRARLIDEGHPPERVLIHELTERGNGDLRDRARDLASWIGTHIPTGPIHIVAHSAGGLVSRDYIARLGGASRVERLIMAGTPNYGTLVALPWSQFAIGSSYLTGLNQGDISIGTVEYWSFATTRDWIAFPYTNQLLPRTGGTWLPNRSGAQVDAQVTNTVIQDQCPTSTVEHLGQMSDATVQSGILQALAGERNIVLDCP